MTFLLTQWKFVVMAFLAGIIGVQQMRINYAHNQFAEYKLTAAKAAQEEAQRKQAAYDEAAEAARKETDALQADVSRLADVADGLRGDIANFKRKAKVTCSSNGSKGQPSTDPLDLLIGLYSRADTEAGVLAEYAAKLRTAGLACEAAADKSR